MLKGPQTGFTSNTSEPSTPPTPFIAPMSSASSLSFTPSVQQYNVYPSHSPHFMETPLDPFPPPIHYWSLPQHYFIPSRPDMPAVGQPQNILSHQGGGQESYIPGDSDNEPQPKPPQPPHNPYFFTPTQLYQPQIHTHLGSHQLGAPPRSNHPSPAKQQTYSHPNSPGVKIVHADDYEQRYPEDPLGSECGPMARVWGIFLDECQEFDAGRLETLQDSVDVLLVFAGLFSAVVTTFVVQTSQSLQADYTKISSYLLYEAVSIQRAMATGVAVSSIPMSPLNPTTTFVASTSDRWVNGLWFTSLSLSLVTALVAVLAKQWIRQHMLASSGTTPRDRARIRQFRYMGFEAWNVPAIIGILPSLLHISLTIFLVGLVVFLIALDRPIACVILTITGGSFALYIIAMFLPVFSPQCPYRTPLTDLLLMTYRELLRWTSKEQDVQYPPSIRELELQTIESQADFLDVQSLSSLYTMSSNPTVHSCVIQSIGGLPVSIKSEELDTAFKGSGIEEKQQELLQECLQPCIDPRYSALIKGKDACIERLLRSRLRLSADIRQSHHSCIPRLLLTPTPYDPPLSEVTALTAVIACHNDVRPTNYPSGADLFLRLAKERQPGSVALHPFVWKSLFSDLISTRFFHRLGRSSHRHALEEFCNLFRRIIAPPGTLWNGAQPQDDGTYTMNLQNALSFGLYDIIEEQLLNALAKFDMYSNDAKVSRHIRLLLAIINYVLSTRSFPAVHWSDPTPSEKLFCVHCLGMFLFAMQDLRICIKEHASLSFRESAAISSTIDEVIMSPLFASEYKPWSHVLWMIRYDVIRILGHMTITRSHNPQSLAHNLFWPISASQRRKCRDMICRVSFNRETLDDLPQGFYALAKCVVEMGGLLKDDMNSGDTTALHTFIDLDVLGFIGRTMFMFPWRGILQAYISAVSRTLESSNAVTVCSDTDSQPYHINTHLNYIHYPGNLAAICIILGGRLARSPDKMEDASTQMTLLKLASLRPLDPVWPACLELLDKFSRDEPFLREQLFLTIKDDAKETRWEPYNDHEVRLIMVRLEESVATLKPYFVQHSNTTEISTCHPTSGSDSEDPLLDINASRVSMFSLDNSAIPHPPAPPYIPDDTD
ncbi:uncharacterized protein EV420DRAFT_1768045 [Desarmillaria tabescens]|uniref:DUF6535 domain-containing protein n=1 Tax=Armillaria tabescens TaxID=1929756 RepID=A0AA39JM59_ARMTA|nr:uncharacterized protein EV420DRAFT_1768045 [Desarmillaria tabescens]KAK0445312.1 hypothetical protein EV420DRAFT_1768045 [Desarmillaria tabescens]